MDIPLYLPHAGPKLLEMPLLNKSSAFTEQERIDFNIDGLLPPRFETIEQQVSRAYLQYSQLDNDMARHIYLRSIQDTNETLFYRLLEQHIEIMMPIIYTPTVGEACERFSDIYRSARGLFIAHHQEDRIDAILHNATKRNVKVIVVTDGERVLGLGDQGVGGMGIPIGKLSLYTVCAGISPAYTLPVMLDVGTNNEQLLNDPMYMGCRHHRIDAHQYSRFIEKFMRAANKRWPGVLIQFEDFAQANAMPLLNKYRHQYCCFNDDIQGTAAVAVASILAACKAKGDTLQNQKVVFVGAGSAGCGIAEQLIACMVQQGLPETQARRKIFMLDSDGLLTTQSTGLHDFQSRLAQPFERLSWWRESNADLLAVIKNEQPDVLVGVSGQAGLFNEQVIKLMHSYCPRPIILPLSNPSRRAEARPADLVAWTRNQAIIATGSPFDDVHFQGQQYRVSQCNNSYIFPGIGLGTLSSGATKVTDAMFMTASMTLARNSPLAETGEGDLLPPLRKIKSISKLIALNVAQVAVEEEVAPYQTVEQLKDNIERSIWHARYRNYQRVAW